MHKQFTIWTNAKLPAAVAEKLSQSVRPHRLLYASEMSSLNLTASPPDAQLAEADIAFGQPDVEQIFSSSKLRWIHLTTAGYTAYDREDLRKHLQSRGMALTNSSGVYAEPCAQHVLAMMMAFARQLPSSLKTQLSSKDWPAEDRRHESFLLNGQTAILFGFGEIATRLCELLAPFRMNLIGVRRRVRGVEAIPMIDESQLPDVLSRADHVINILPANSSTSGYFDESKFSMMKNGAYFYNIGRGATVHQEALRKSLTSGRLAGAYLDVMTPEPLPPDNALWTTPNCFITPHTAGGFHEEMNGLVSHFLVNLRRLESNEGLLNRIV